MSAITPESEGRGLWDAAVGLVADPTAAGRVLEWAIATVTAVTPFPDPDSPPPPIPVGMVGTGAGTGPAGEVLTFVYGPFIPRVGRRVLLCRPEGGAYFVEDVLQ